MLLEKLFQKKAKVILEYEKFNLGAPVWISGDKVPEYYNIRDCYRSWIPSKILLIFTIIVKHQVELTELVQHQTYSHPRFLMPRSLWQTAKFQDIPQENYKRITFNDLLSRSDKISVSAHDPAANTFF